MVRRALKLVLFASALGGGGLLAVAVSRETVHGSGVRASEDRDVGAITAVSLSGTGDLTILSGPTPSLTVTADDNVLPLIETETDGATLTLRTRSRTDVRPQTKIAYTLTVPRLSAVTVSGAGNVTAHQLTTGTLTVKLSGAGTANLEGVACKSLTLQVSGAGGARATGVAERLTVKLSGAGEVDASGLKAQLADAQVSGSGSASVFATLNLNARVSGAGNVTYKGRPHVEQKVSGAGRVRSVE